MRATGAALLVVAVAACGGDDPGAGGQVRAARRGVSATAEPRPGQIRRIELVVTGGRPVGGVRTVSVDLGDQVVLSISSDSSDDVHVHGYDLSAPLAPDAPAVLTFAADKPGAWDVELHDAGTLLLELQVD